MGLRLKAKTPSVISLSGRSASMPTRKLCLKETTLNNNNNSPVRQNNTPVQEIISEWKNSCLKNPEFLKENSLLLKLCGIWNLNFVPRLLRSGRGRID